MNSGFLICVGTFCLYDNITMPKNTVRLLLEVAQMYMVSFLKWVLCSHLEKESSFCHQKKNISRDN